MSRSKEEAAAFLEDGLADDKAHALREQLPEPYRVGCLRTVFASISTTGSTATPPELDSRR
jgi:hypothetical protein